MQTNKTSNTSNNSQAISENVTSPISDPINSVANLSLSQLECESTSSLKDYSFTTSSNPLTRIDELNNWLINHPEDNDARLARADLLMVVDEISQAVDDYLILYQTNKSQRILDALVNGYVKKGLVKMFYGTFNDSIQEYNNALELAPTCGKALYYRGLAFQRSNEFAKADLDYQKVLEYDRGYTSAWTGRGFIAHSEGRLEDAIAFFEQAHALDSSDGEIGKQLIEVYQQKGQRDNIDYKEVISKLEFTLQISRSDFNMAMNQGHKHYKDWNYKHTHQCYERAVQCYERAHQLNPLDINAMGCLADSLSKLNRYSEAISILERAKELDPQNKDIDEVLYEAYRGRAATYEQEGEFQKAISCYSWMLRFDPEDGFTREKRGIALFHAGYFSFALGELEKEQKSHLLPYIGACLYNVGQISRSIIILNNAKNDRIGETAFIDLHLNEAHRKLHRHLKRL